VTRPALLDVNFLVALFDPDHIHHDAAHDWFADERAHGWATCPLTENGLVRVVTNAAYGAAPIRAARSSIGYGRSVEAAITSSGPTPYRCATVKSSSRESSAAIVR
jgi:predicted nucleic acid-binding protein